MGNHDNGSSILSQLVHPPVALGLEKYVPHRQRLVYNQNLRLHVDGEGEGQTDEHTAGIGLHRLIHKVPDIGKFQNVRELLVHLFLGKAHHGSVHVNIFNTCVVLVKPGSQLQKGGNLSVHLHFPGRGGENSRNNL